MAFKYDVVTLLELIEARPCLWDKSIEEYKDKLLKHTAWIEVFQCLEEGYDELSTKERKAVAEIIRAKWVNIKDAFLKTIKTKSGPACPKKSYVYADHLQFLLRCSKKENTTDSPDIISTENEEDVEESDVIRSPIKKKPKKMIMVSRKFDNFKKQIITELKKPQLKSSPDENFFMSFVPYIKDMTENEKIDLQINILNYIKEIKSNRLNCEFATNNGTQDKIFSQSSPTSSSINDDVEFHSDMKTQTARDKTTHTYILPSKSSRNSQDLSQDTTQLPKVIIKSTQLFRPGSSTQNEYQHLLDSIKRE